MGSAVPYRDNLIAAKDNLPPTLHIWGNKDPRVDPSESKKLTEFFPKVQVLTHDGGHYIPTNAASKDGLRNFIKDNS